METWRKYYRFSTYASFGIYAVVAVYAVLTHNLEALAIVPLLAVLEISLSFDNAIVNAKYVSQLSPTWQERFMKYGILIAVFGMRFLFPVIVVSLTALANPVRVAQEAATNPQAYATSFLHAHVPLIVFGSIYLLQIGINYFLNGEDKEATWLVPLERPLEWFGEKTNSTIVVPMTAAVATLLLGLFMWPDRQDAVWLWGAAAVVLFWAVSALGNRLDGDDEDGTAKQAITNLTGRAAVGVFLYLEVQDAAFSFDGIMGAFAFTLLVVLILAGNGIGALFVRSMTIQLVRTNALSNFRYLGSGAFWAIAVLPFAMWFSLPDYVTGGLSVVLIAAALLHSLHANRRDAAAATVPVTTDTLNALGG